MSHPRVVSAAAALCSLLVLALSACSATPDPEPTPPPSAPASTPASTVTETQVASALARYKPDFDSAISGAMPCLVHYAQRDIPDSYAAGVACYYTDQAAVIDAYLLLEDWAALGSIPESVGDLVASTADALGGVAAVDLRGVCGEDSLPVETEECNHTLGALAQAYLTLESELAAWSPYL
jgi:hypothetical protein